MLDGLLDDILLPSTDRAGIVNDFTATCPCESPDNLSFSPDSPNSPYQGLYDDDRHYCSECCHLNSTGYCVQERYRPVDDIPRRCSNFVGLLKETGIAR